MCARYAANVSRGSNTDYFFRLIGLIISIGAAVAVAITILNMISMGFELNSRVLLIFILVDIALVTFPIIMFASGKADKNNFARFGCMALVALLLFVNLFISTNLNATDDVLKSGYQSVSYGVVEYSVIAQRSAGIELSKKNSVVAGIQRADENKTEVEKETKKLTSATFNEFDNVSEMVVATEDRTLDIAVVRSSLLTAFAEYFPDSYENLKVLATFKVGTKGSAQNAIVDINKPFSIYVSGVDVFGDIDQVARSDSNMIVLVDPEHYKILLINTPRDYYVQLYGTKGTRDKLTHAGVMGVDVSKATLEQLYGFDIDYYVRINFDTVIKLIDAMGGINVDNPVAFGQWGYGYAEGVIWLNGDMALTYARARKGLAHGDEDRGQNQQRVIEGIVKRITSPEVVVLYKDILEAMRGTFRTNIPPTVVAQLFSRQISLGGDWTFEKMSATGRGDQRPTYSMGDQPLSVIIPDENSLNEIRNAIQDFLNQR